jgi:hypothetical protein
MGFTNNWVRMTAIFLYSGVLVVEEDEQND